MAQQNKTTTGAKKGAAKAKTTNAENQTKANETIEAAPVVPKRPSRIEDSTLVYVKSNTFGGLTFVDKRSGETIDWEFCGDIQPVSMSLLRSIKASAAIFFTENKILVDSVDDGEHTPEDVYNALAVSRYYKDIIDPDDFQKVCGWSVKDIKTKVPLLTTTARENLVVALNTFIEDGTLDSLKKIRAFEEALGCNLMKSER